MTAAPNLAAEPGADFEFSCGPYAPGELAVLAFDATEELSQPYHVDVSVAAVGPSGLDAGQLLGAEGRLTVRLPDGGLRTFHGLVCEVERWGEGPSEAHHRARVRLVPRLWRLGQVRRSRIFQERSVPELVQRVLKDAGVAVRMALGATYPKRGYCVQYRESDLAFVSRLLEEAGIFYFFEHGDEDAGHVMVLADSHTAYPEAPVGEVPFREQGGMVGGQDAVDAFAAREALRPDTVVVRDFDYLRPSLDLTGKESAGDSPALEVYDFPARFAEPGAARALARIRLEEERVEARTATGAGTVRQLAAGHTFTLAEHPVPSLNARYVLVSVRHAGQQLELLAGGGVEDGAQRPPRYRCEFTCLTADTPFRPARLTPRPTIPGPQTAIVVGPAGEEIFTDAHGRIKVQFHWDREGRHDERSSCWIRVSQAWAGGGYGALYLPRVGSEVVVEFLEGDPDAPVVIGSLYNGENPPPLALPDQKTQSTLRTASSPGGSGFNELRFEDAAGEEEVYLHAQRDLRVEVENDRAQEVGGHERLVVKKSRTREVAGSESVQVKKDDALTVSGDQRVEVGKSRSVQVKGGDTEQVGGDQAVNVGGGLSLTVARASTETVGQAKTVNVGGAYALTVGGALKETVGGARSEDVGGAKAETVGGKKSEVIQGARSLQVGGDSSETVGGKSTVKVAKDLTQNVGGKLVQAVGGTYTLKAKELVLSAEDTFVLKVGSATIEVKKGGDISIKGAKLELSASGDLILKGSTIAEN